MAMLAAAKRTNARSRTSAGMRTAFSVLRAIPGIGSIDLVILSPPRITFYGTATAESPPATKPTAFCHEASSTSLCSLTQMHMCPHTRALKSYPIRITKTSHWAPPAARCLLNMHSTRMMWRPGVRFLTLTPTKRGLSRQSDPPGLLTSGHRTSWRRPVTGDVGCLRLRHHGCRVLLLGLVFDARPPYSETCPRQGMSCGSSWGQGDKGGPAGPASADSGRATPTRGGDLY